jgi:predicted nucleotidyltransferase
MNDFMKRIKEISQRIKEQYNAQRVILFGSHARNEATDDSDVDILIIAPTKERFYQRMATIKRLVRDLRNGLTIAPLILTREELEKRIKRKDQFINEILETGIEL